MKKWILGAGLALAITGNAQALPVSETHTITASIYAVAGVHAEALRVQVSASLALHSLQKLLTLTPSVGLK